MFCSKCGSQAAQGKFCINCGASLQPSAPAQSAQTPGALPPVASPLSIPMAYDSHQASSARNWLEKIVSYIPGYKGYQDKETRRDVDKLHREHVASMLFELKQPINNVIRELSETGRLFEVNPVDRILKKLDKLENRIRYASYGYRGFFDVVKIQEAQLDQLYQFDLALVNDVELLKARVEQFVKQSSDKNSLKAAALELDRALDELDNKFSRRYEAIENPAWFPY